MATVTTTETKSVTARYLKAEAGVRYWEDAKVDGVEDEGGELIPFRNGDNWCPVIDLDAGVVEDWPTGKTASIHYKVCDEGRYALLDADRAEIVAIEGYVPGIMSPGGSGFGDYIIMNIGGGGEIADWRVCLAEFEDALA